MQLKVESAKRCPKWISPGELKYKFLLPEELRLGSLSGQVQLQHFHGPDPYNAISKTILNKNNVL